MGHQELSGSGLVWAVEPLAAPVVVRRCPRCDGPRGFVCSGKFRVNANQRRLDVWLIYRCGVCERTWNCTILERVKPEDIAVEALAGFHANDAALAMRWAFDAGALERAGVRPEPVEGFRVEGVRGEALPARAVIRLSLGVPLGVRLDRVLAAGLEIPRSRIKGLVKRGAVEIDGGERALSRSARDGQVVRWCRDLGGAGWGQTSL